MSFKTNGYKYEEGNDEYDTPIEFFKPISKAIGGFDLDPSASSTSNLAKNNLTIEDDGLSYDWYGDVWLNPPYSDVSTWMEYATNEYKRGNADNIVALVFARTSTQWFHNFARQADLLCFVEGRLRFGKESVSNAPAPSLVAVWGPIADNDRLVEYLSNNGMLVHTIKMSNSYQEKIV